MAADQDHLTSLLWLAHFHSEKKNKSLDLHLAFTSYLAAAECGSSDAQ